MNEAAGVQRVECREHGKRDLHRVVERERAAALKAAEKAAAKAERKAEAAAEKSPSSED